jgi:hypothetical protein
LFDELADEMLAWSMTGSDMSDIRRSPHEAAGAVLPASALKDA